MTLREVADALGKSISTVGAWTQAKNFPEVEVQPRLAEYLKEPLTWLIHGLTENVEITQSTESKVEETASDYGKYSVKKEDAGELEARRLFEETLRLARNDPERLGWVLVQLRRHLRPPEYWQVYTGKPEDHPAVKEAKARAHQNAFRNQGDEGKTDRDTERPKAAS